MPIPVPVPVPVPVPAGAPAVVAAPAPSSRIPGDGRRVVVRVWPNSSDVTIDDQPVTASSVFRLPAGVHSMMVTGSCCYAHSRMIEVVEDPDDRIQIVAVTLVLKVAKVTLRGGPPHGVLTCDNGRRMLADSTAEVELELPSEIQSCRFHPGNVPIEVQLTAGSHAVIPWPD